MHMPIWHVLNPASAQEKPQVPQLLGSLDVSTQALLQSVWPVGQDGVQTEFTHASDPPEGGAGQAMLHIPQLLMLLVVSTHVLPQSV